MSAGCPLCGDAHTLDHCPRWRAKAMHGISSAMSHLAIYGECMMRSEADGTVRHVPKSEYAQPEQAKPTDLQMVVLRLKQIIEPKADSMSPAWRALDALYYLTGDQSFADAADAAMSAQAGAEQQPVTVPARELTDADIERIAHPFWLRGAMEGEYADFARAIAHHLTAPHGESDKTVGSDHA